MERGVSYRTFVAMMRSSSASPQGVDSSNNDSSSSSFFSTSLLHSVLDSLALPNGGVRHGAANDDSDDDLDHPDLLQSDASASDRAARLERNPALQRLLASEVEKEGVVTAAGYRAVRERFLYGDAVESELRRERRRPPRRRAWKKERSGRSLGLLASQAPASKKRLSSDGGGGASQRSAADGSRRSSLDSAASSSGEPPRACGEECNLAPVKSSLVRCLTAEERTILTEERELRASLKKKSLRASLVTRRALEDIDRRHNASYAQELGEEDADEEEEGTIEKEEERVLERRDSCGSLGLGDVFDGTEGSSIFVGPAPLPPVLRPRCATEKSREADSQGNPFCKGSARFVKGGKSESLPVPSSEPRCTRGLLKMSSLPLRFDDEDESDVEFDVLDAGRDDLKSSTTDPLGWLPWPHANDEDDDSVRSADEACDINDGEELLVPFRRRDDLSPPPADSPTGTEWHSRKRCSTCSSSDDESLAEAFRRVRCEEAALLSWPAEPRTGRARAA